MSIPQKIKQLANKVRNEIKGVDVRESIAKSMEVTGETAEEAKDKSIEQTERVDALIRENPQPSEVVDARGNHNLLGDRLNSVDQQLAHKAKQADLDELTVDVKKAEDTINENVDYIQEAYDFSLFPQSPKPPKAGFNTKSHKIIHKRTNTSLYITQKTNKGYVQYRLEKDNGASQEGRDYGQNHELLRLIRARHVPQAYVYFDVSSPHVGSVETSVPPSGFNDVEQMIVPNDFIDTSRNLHSGKEGIGSYRFASGSSVTYRIDSKVNEKINLLFWCTTGSSDKIDIFINDELIESFNPREYTPSYGDEIYAMRLVELDVPINVKTNRLDIRIENNGSSGWANLCAINFFELKDYRGQHITQYKTFGSTKSGWIENPGASDYAIRDSEGLLFGSYHGGEEIEESQILFNSNPIRNYPNNEYDTVNIPFSEITHGAWSVQPDFNVYQRTSLANGEMNTKMISVFNFDIDGSLEMDFAYSSDGLPITSFRTAMTSVAVDFRHVTHPIYNVFPETPTETFLEVPTTEGRVSQVSVTSGLQIDHRFTKFNKRYSERGVFIVDNPAYRKFYYGPLDGTYELKLRSLQFAKGMDFIVR